MKTFRVAHLRPDPSHRTQQPVATAWGHSPRVHQHEATRAISRLGHAGIKASLPKRGRLLVARHAGDGNGRAQQCRIRQPQFAARRHDLRQHAGRHIEEPQERIIPSQRMDVEQQGARGIARIGGVHTPAGQLPQQPTVNRAKRQLPRLGPLACAGHMV